MTRSMGLKWSFTVATSPILRRWRWLYCTGTFEIRLGIIIPLILGLELLSRGSGHSCDRQFWYPGQLAQSLHYIKRVSIFMNHDIHLLISHDAWCRKVRAIFPSLLSCLCLADISFLTSSLFLVPVTLGWTGSTFLTLYSIFDCFSHISLSGSVFLTVAITFERYKAVCLAHNYNYRNARIGHRSLVLRYVCPVLVLAILLNIPKLIEISPLGDILKNNYSFWPLFVLYQVNYSWRVTF